MIKWEYLAHEPKCDCQDLIQRGIKWESEDIDERLPSYLVCRPSLVRRFETTCDNSCCLLRLIGVIQDLVGFLGVIVVLVGFYFPDFELEAVKGGGPVAHRAEPANDQTYNSYRWWLGSWIDDDDDDSVVSDDGLLYIINFFRFSFSPLMQLMLQVTLWVA